MLSKPFACSREPLASLPSSREESSPRPYSPGARPGGDCSRSRRGGDFPSPRCPSPPAGRPRRHGRDTIFSTPSPLRGTPPNLGGELQSHVVQLVTLLPATPTLPGYPASSDSRGKTPFHHAAPHRFPAKPLLPPNPTGDSFPPCRAPPLPGEASPATKPDGGVTSPLPTPPRGIITSNQ